MPARPDPGPFVVSRRDVLTRSVATAALVGLTAATSACGLRLEADAPDLPLAPREPYAGTPALRSAWAQVDVARAAALAALGARTTPALTRLLTAFVTGSDQQLAALASRLDAVGEPAAPTSNTSPTRGGASRTASPSPAPRAVAGAMTAGLDVAHRRGLAASPSADVVLLAGVHVTRSAAAVLAGAAPVAAPTSPTLPTAVAADLLGSADAALYGLEVVATRAATGHTGLAASSRTTLGRLRDDLLRIAGVSAPATRLGYALPHPVRTAADADRLAADLHARLSSALLGAAPQVLGAPDAMRTLLTWAADAETTRARWGATWRPFPIPPNSPE